VTTLLVIDIGNTNVSLGVFDYEDASGTPQGKLSEHWRTTAVLALYSALFVAALDVLGGLVSMAAYMAAALWTLNRRRHWQNALLAVLLPLILYLMFRVWLNAAVPRGLLPF